MEVDCIAFRETGYLSELICDYLDKKQELKPFYNRTAELDNFKAQIEEKTKNFPLANRKVLAAALKNQYSGIEASDATLNNITSLANKNTFTIVTGHQLNLFTGPLYFLYKIISTINLTEQLKEAYPDFNFVPVYWMATEDHDFEEINYFNHKGKKIHWNTKASGGVGRLSTESLETVFKIITSEFGDTDNAIFLKNLFKNSYLKNETLTNATRFLANELFGKYGLVIIDGDDSTLKRLLLPYAKKDIFDHLPYKIVSKSITELESISDKYKIQVNPREINYFYLKDNIRERIIEKEGAYLINNTTIQFTSNELEEELEKHPERFSPNVIARPLYQEVILPNLCYIGGGGELSYWLELKAYFKALDITFPMLLLRNSALVITEKQNQKIDKLEVDLEDLFLKQNQLINKKIRKISNIDIDFSTQKKHLTDQFIAMYRIAEETDKSFFGAVKAQEVKQKKGLDVLEKRLLKAQKKKLKDHVVRLTALQNQLFPNQSLRERQLNFSELYLMYGANLIPSLKEKLKPLQNEFIVLRH